MHQLVSLGVEEELQVVNQHSLQLMSHDFLRGKSLFPDEDGTSSKEIHQPCIEIQTAICQNADEIVASLAQMRSVVRRRAYEQGQYVLAGGVHPCSDWKIQNLHLESSHYARLVEQYGDVVRSLMCYGMHVHLGIPSDIDAMPVFNSLAECLARYFGDFTERTVLRRARHRFTQLAP